MIWFKKIKKLKISIAIFWERIFHRREIKRLRQKEKIFDSFIDDFNKKNFMILNGLEKALILQALRMKEFRQEIESPPQKASLRIFFRNLKEKFEKETKKGEKSSQEILRQDIQSPENSERKVKEKT